jgi:hypothetical protein
MKRVVLESPFAPSDKRTLEQNIDYAKLCMHDCFERNEAPFASHLLYTQPKILNDADPNQRKLGIVAGHQWILGCDYVVVYVDYGISPGMEQGILAAQGAKKEIFYRSLFLKGFKITKE